MTMNYEFKVRWGDTDAAGIVFFPNFYKWMNEASHELLNKIGVPVAGLQYEEKIGFPLLETHCVFKSALFFEDVVTIRSSIVEIGNKVFKVNHEFYRGEQLVAEGYEVRAWTSFEGKPKAVTIPDDKREKLMSAYSDVTKV